MADQFVTLAGLSWLSTDDVNLLNADAAHTQQGTGGMTTTVGMDFLSLVAAPAGKPYGDNAIMMRKSVAAGQEMTIRLNPTHQVGTPGSVEYVGGYLLYIDADPVADTGASAGIEYFDVGDVYINGTYKPFTPKFREWFYVDTGSFITGAQTVWGRSYIRFPDDLPDNAEVYYGAGVIRKGTNPTFTPSLRVTGILDQEIDVSLVDWSPAVDQAFIGRWGSQKSHLLVAAAGGAAVQYMSDDGVTTRGLSAAAGWGVADGVRALIATIVDPDDGANSKAEYFVDAAPIATGTSTQFSGIWPGNQPLRIGADAANSRWYMDGNIYGFTQRDGVGGPIIAALDIENYYGPDTDVPDGHQWANSADGRIWTVHGDNVSVTGVGGASKRNSQVMMR